MTAQPRRGDLVVETRPPNIAKLRQERPRVGQETLGATIRSWVLCRPHRGGFLRGRVHKDSAPRSLENLAARATRDAAPTALTALMADAIAASGWKIFVSPSGRPLCLLAILSEGMVRGRTRNGPREMVRWSVVGPGKDVSTPATPKKERKLKELVSISED